MLLRGSGWQATCDTAAATLPGVIYVQCITVGLNPAPDMQDPAISHAEIGGWAIRWVTGLSKCCLRTPMPPLFSYWQAEDPISPIFFSWWHFKCSKHILFFYLDYTGHKKNKSCLQSTSTWELPRQKAGYSAYVVKVCNANEIILERTLCALSCSCWNCSKLKQNSNPSFTLNYSQ